MTYIVNAPVVVTPDKDGTLRYHYRGSVISWLSDEDAARLLLEDLIDEIEEPIFEPDEVVGGGETGNEGGGDQRPNKTAPVAEWEAYAVSRGWKLEDAKALNKPDLIAALSGS